MGYTSSGLRPLGSCSTSLLHRQPRTEGYLPLGWACAEGVGNERDRGGVQDGQGHDLGGIVRDRAWLLVHRVPHRQEGRFLIQLSGFLLMSVFMAIFGFRYKILRGENCKSTNTGVCGGHPVEFMILYALTFFFANFGPNSTTFIVPAELFPARFRSTCHGISAASGKAGAILGAFLVQKYTFDGDTKKIQRSIIALAVVNFLGFLFTFLVPETKGKSLEEISGEDKDFGGRGEGAHGLHSDDMV